MYLRESITPCFQSIDWLCTGRVWMFDHTILDVLGWVGLFMSGISHKPIYHCISILFIIWWLISTMRMLEWNDLSFHSMKIIMARSHCMHQWMPGRQLARSLLLFETLIIHDSRLWICWKLWSERIQRRRKQASKKTLTESVKGMYTCTHWLLLNKKKHVCMYQHWSL